jgi:electron transport complex protein RnfG
MGISAVGRLGVLALAVALAIAVTAVATHERIARNETGRIMKVIATVLPRDLYDNEPALDRILVRAPELLGSSEALPLYRARRNGEPAAAVVTVVAPQGFAGPIRLLVAIAADGKVLAVRAIAHEETPGLGDRIDAAKSDWIRRFNGRSIADPAPERWAVRRDGGEFDQLTGATVTSRAVVNAVRDAALYFQQHRDEVFALPAQ